MLPKIYVIVQVCILEEHEILQRHGFNILLALPFFLIASLLNFFHRETHHCWSRGRCLFSELQ